MSEVRRHAFPELGATAKEEVRVPPWMAAPAAATRAAAFPELDEAPARPVRFGELGPRPAPTGEGTAAGGEAPEPPAPDEDPAPAEGARVEAAPPSPPPAENPRSLVPPPPRSPTRPPPRRDAVLEAHKKAETERLQAEAQAAVDQAREELEAHFAQIVEEERRGFAEALAELPGLRDAALRELAPALEEPMLELALGIAEILVGEAARRDRALAARLVREALGALAERGVEGDVRLRVSPETKATLDEGDTRLRYGDAEVTVLEDPSLEGLGAVALAGELRVDGTLGGRFEAIREAVLEEHRREPEA
jgi:flagellar biosynthesis/type III secretory pathway protein FliH